MGKIVVLMGASASGKDSIQKYILKRSSFNFKPIIMHTTRPIREGEVNGRDYYFCTEKEMNEYDEAKQIIEKRTYQTVYGDWHYFTVNAGIDLNRYNYLTLNTLNGLDAYLNYFKEENLVSILISIDDGERLLRAIKREMKEVVPKYDEVCRRFLSDSRDFSLEEIKKRPITATIDNGGDFSKTVEEVEKVLRKCL